MTARRASLLVALVAAVVGTACGGGDGGGGPTKPVAGELMVRLTSPNATDGALIVRVVGPVTAVTPVGTYTISTAFQGNITRVIVTGRIRQRSWETPEGERRSVVEIEADPRLHGRSKVANARRIRMVMREILAMRWRELRAPRP